MRRTGIALGLALFLLVGTWQLVGIWMGVEADGKF